MSVEVAIAIPISFRPCRIVFDVIFVCAGLENFDQISAIENSIQVGVARRRVEMRFDEQIDVTDG